MILLKNITKIAASITTELPASIVADAITFGGVCADTDEPYTVSSIKKTFNQIQNLTEELK